MEKFKTIIEFINRTIGMFGLGFSINRVFSNDYKTASWILLIISILFVVGYYVELLTR